MVDLYNRRWIPDYIGQRPEDDPQYIAYMRQQGMQVGQQALPMPQQPQAPAPSMRPYIDTRMLEAASYEDAENYRMSPGTSQVFYLADRSGFVVKEQGQNGYEIHRYPREPEKPPKPPLDPANYVTWDGLDARVDARLAQLLNASQPQPQQQKEVG